MLKLIYSFQKNPSLKTALAVLKYARQHPMSACLYPYEIGGVEAFYQAIMKEADDLRSYPVKATPRMATRLEDNGYEDGTARA